MMSEPEIIPPGGQRTGRAGKRGDDLFDDEHLDVLSHLLDDFLRVPGTPIRFGLDGIVGFIPGIGDVIGGIASSIIILAAWARGVPLVTVARMLLNVGIETLGGALPVVGNLFDIGWKANRRNYKLLTGSLVEPQRNATQSWLVFGAICAVLVGLMLLPGLLFAWVVVRIAAGLHGG